MLSESGSIVTGKQITRIKTAAETAAMFFTCKLSLSQVGLITILRKARMMQSDSMKKTEVEGAANRFLTLARKALLDVQEPLAMANDNLKGDFTDFRTAEQVTTLMTAITQMFQGAQARIEAALPGLTALIREMQNADGADEKSAATMDDETMLAIADEIMNRYDDDFRALAE